MKSPKVETLGTYHSTICAHIHNKIEELAEYMSVYGLEKTIHASTEIFWMGK